MNSVKNFKIGLFLGIFSLSLFSQGLSLTEITYAQEPSKDVEKVQIVYSEKDLSAYKINFLTRFFLNFKVKFTPAPEVKLESTFKIWADRLYRLNLAKESGKISRINKALGKYTQANDSFEKALNLARATLADAEVDKILGMQDIIEKYAGFSGVAINVLEGVRIIYAQAPEETARQGGSLTAARQGLDENLKAVESVNREAQRLASDSIYREYRKLMTSGRLSSAQQGLLTLKFFEAEREQAQ